MSHATRLLGTALVALAVPLAAACGASGDDGGTSASATSSSVAPVPDDTIGVPDSPPVPVPAPIAEKWRASGAENGPLGAPRGGVTDAGHTRRVDFQGGSVFLVTDAATGQARAFVVQGEILKAYDGDGGPAGPLGAPTSDEATTDGGWISVFEHGSITVQGGHAEIARR